MWPGKGVILPYTCLMLWSLWCGWKWFQIFSLIRFIEFMNFSGNALSITHTFSLLGRWKITQIAHKVKCFVTNGNNLCHMIKAYMTIPPWQALHSNSKHPNIILNLLINIQTDKTFCYLEVWKTRQSSGHCDNS